MFSFKPVSDCVNLTFVTQTKFAHFAKRSQFQYVT